MKHHKLLLWILLLNLVLGMELRAQTYSLDWFKVAGGGATSSNNQYSLSGTIGQQDASSPMTGGAYSLVGGFWAISAVQTPGAPTLFIFSSGANAVLYWSASAAGYHLESNADLALVNGWASVPAAPATLNGFNYVTNTIAPGNRFFRLHSP